MKLQLSTGQAADLLNADDNANWTYPGARALIEYLERLEEDCETEYTLDVVALRCEFSQYESLEAWENENLGANEDGSTTMRGDYQLREYIQDRGQLIEFDGGIIVSAF